MNKKQLRSAIRVKDFETLKLHRQVLELEYEINKNLSLKDLKECLEITNLAIFYYHDMIKESKRVLMEEAK